MSGTADSAQTQFAPVPAIEKGRLVAGAALCLLIAAAAYVAGRALPAIGAPLFAIAIGAAVVNGIGASALARALRIKEVSSFALRGGIVLLGATLQLRDVAGTGVASLGLLVVTIGAGLGFSLGLGRFMRVDWRMRCLIGVGTTICGASAIAALAPLVRARTHEIAYAISVIFVFNMVAVAAFPALGHAMHLSDQGFGLWAGTAVNDTSAVVAAGFAYSAAAGSYATIVKLTRTTLILPVVLAFGLALRRHNPAASAAGRLRHAIPWFIALFLLASVANSLGLFRSAAGVILPAARFVLVIALAAVGLQSHWRVFVGAGLQPLALGLGTWAAVAIASLAVQFWTGLS